MSNSMVAVGALCVTLCALWPRATFAEVVLDADRQGEWDERGARFDDVVVSGKLERDATGWILVRTVENLADAPRTLDVEERVLETETVRGARVTPPPVAVVLRGWRVTLGPHQRRSLGVRLSPSVSDHISRENAKAASVESRFADAIATGRTRDSAFTETYRVFNVEYMRTLPPGATAERPDPSTLGQRPMAMPMVMPGRLDTDGPL